MSQKVLDCSVESYYYPYILEYSLYFVVLTFWELPNWAIAITTATLCVLLICKQLGGESGQTVERFLSVSISGSCFQGITREYHWQQVGCSFLFFF